MLQPTRLISTPFAQEGEKTEIQNVTGEFDNSATYRLGFPPLTMQSIRLGGKPPKGTDFNGVLFDITENISFLCKGGRYQYNAGLSTLIGGYPEGSNLLLDDNVTEVVSTVAGNQNNPNTNMTGWILKPNKTTAVNVADASGETQQQVNYNGGSKWHSRVGGYQENERAVLDNGNIVKSTVDGNTNDPNVDMTGWVKTNSASQIVDESGLSQQEINNALKIEETFFYTPAEDNTASLVSLMSTHSNIIIPDLGVDCILSDNVLIPDGVSVEIRGIVRQQTSGREIASSSITSNFPLFKMSSNSTIKTSGDGKILSYYEAIQAVGAALDGVMSIKNPAIDVNCECISIDEGYGQFSGIVTYATENLDLGNSKAVGYGKKPTWDAANNQMVYGGYHGFCIYLSQGVRGNITALQNGGNGVFVFACNDNYLDVNAHYNGLSGFQIAPSDASWYKCGGIVKVHATNNYADGFDVRWTGAGRVSLGNLVVETNCENNGFFENDKTKPTQDGSGISTFAFVKDAIILPSTSKDSAGAGLYIQGCENIKSAGRSVATVYTAKEGLFIGDSCSNIDVDLDVTTRGTALSFGGGQQLSNITVNGTYKSLSGRGIIVADSTQYNDVNVRAEISSGANLDVYLAGKVNFDGSKFVNEFGGSYFVTGQTGSMRNTSGEFSSGGITADFLAYPDFTGVNYNSVSGTALNLKRCTHPTISGNLYSTSGVALSLEGAGSDFTNNVHLHNLRLKSVSGKALRSISTIGIFDEGGVKIEGATEISGAGITSTITAFNINTSWPVGSVLAGETKTATYAQLGAKVGAIAHVALSSGSKGGLLYAEVMNNNYVNVVFKNITGATIELGNPNVKIQICN